MKKARSRLAHNKNKKLVGGRYVANYSRIAQAWLMLFAGVVVLGGGSYQQWVDGQPLIDPKVKILEVEQVYAVAEPEVVVVPTPEFTIEWYIEEVFGEDAETMKKIAQCESGMKPDRIGDTHIMGNLNGEMIGDSIGLFQIRTGDAGVYDSKPWNRAKANGMTVEEFRTYLKDPKNNIDYAKDIYDRQGIGAWYNCSRKVK